MKSVFFTFLTLGLFTQHVFALPLTNYFEAVLLPSVSTEWQTVALDNIYTNPPVVVCTYVLSSFSGLNPPAVTRIQTITISSFQVKIQVWEDSATSTSAVHCMVLEEGGHTLPDGREIEAHIVTSTETNGNGDWNQNLLENVSTSIVNIYRNPVVVGQVMSYENVSASVFYNTDCDNRANHPFQSGMVDGICVGKHIGRVNLPALMKP